MAEKASFDSKLEQGADFFSKIDKTLRTENITEINRSYWEDREALRDRQFQLATQGSFKEQMRRLALGEDPSGLDPDDYKSINTLKSKLDEKVKEINKIHAKNLEQIKKNNERIKREQELQKKKQEELVDKDKLKEAESYRQLKEEARSQSAQMLGKRDEILNKVNSRTENQFAGKKYTDKDLSEEDRNAKDEHGYSYNDYKKAEESYSMAQNMYENAAKEADDKAYEKLNNDKEYQDSVKQEEKLVKENEKRISRYEQDMEKGTAEINSEIERENARLREKMKKENAIRALSYRFFFGLTDPNMPVNLIQRMFDEDWNLPPVLSETREYTLDEQWVSSRFMLGLKDLPNELRGYLFKTTAHFKFMGTAIGQHVSCNPPPQFCRYTDPRALDTIFPYVLSVKGTKNTDNKYHEESSVTYGKATIGEFLPKGKTSESKIRKETGGMDYAPFNGPSGLGHYYAEAIDDPKQLLYLQFGVPKFNGLLDILRQSVSYVDAAIANEGRIPTTYINVDPYIYGLTFLAAPYISTLALISKFLIGDILLGDKPYNYYYLDPAMHVYWATVNTIANHFATDLGILTPLLVQKSRPASAYAGNKLIRTGSIINFDLNQIKRFNAAMPYGQPLIDEQTGYIDVRYIVSRYQAMLDNIMYTTVRTLGKKGKEKFDPNQDTPDKRDSKQKEYVKPEERESNQGSWAGYRKAMEEDFFNLDNETISGIVAGIIREKQNTFTSFTDANLFRSNIGFTSVGEASSVNSNDKLPYQEGRHEVEPPVRPEIPENKDYIRDVFNNGEESETGGLYDEMMSRAPKFITSIVGGIGQLWNTFKTYVYKNGTMDDYWRKVSNRYTEYSRGALRYAVFSVQYTGQSSDSFSNSVGEMETGGIIKSIGRGVRHAKFNFQAGKTGIGVVDDVINVVKDFSMSIVDNVSFGLSNIVRGVLMGAYTDIPKIWEDSDCSFQNITYNIDLVAPYGNAYSRFQNIYLPLSMLLAGALPLRVGKASYTSPFLCSAYCRGVQNVRLGMITDLTITRGTTNIGHTLDKQVNGMSVSFTITDFNHKVAAPINNTVFAKTFGPIVDQNSAFADFSTIVTGKTLEDTTWLSNRLKYRISAVVKTYQGLMSPDNLASLIADTSASHMLADLFYHHYMPEPGSN